MSLELRRLGSGPLSPDATQFMVRMRDGVHLATDVYLPPHDTSPGPTVLVRLPYDKTGEYTFMPTVARYFRDHGYRVVVQDVRGKFRSEGETLVFVNEAYDGYDTIDWVVNQTWSDGVVGMWGDSYYGFTQWAAVSTAHPALRAITPRVTGTQLGQIPVALPGERTLEVEMSIHRFYLLSVYHDRSMLEWEMDWTRQPLIDAVEEFFAQVGSRSPSFDLWFPHPVSLRRFPAGSPFDAPAIPVLMTIGWWDNCAPYQWADHYELQKRPAWAMNEHLLLEAIDHENNNHFDLPGHRHPTESHGTLERYLGPAVEFFDVHLRGRAAQVPRVRWVLANSGDPVPRQAASWPPAGVTARVLHLTDATAAAGAAPGGGLTKASPEEEVAFWVHDPTDPVPSPAHNSFEFLAENPDERALGQRADVLKFSTPVLEEAMDLVGPVTFSGIVGSDGPEMDTFARLCDVSPDGTARLIVRGQRTLLCAERDFHLEIDMGQTAYRVPAGHRLLLTVASSDAPEFIPVPGTGEHRWLAVRTQANRQRLRLGGDDGARLTLSVLAPEQDC
jgi:predicted acyl esterase